MTTPEYPALFNEPGPWHGFDWSKHPSSGPAAGEHAPMTLDAGWPPMPDPEFVAQLARCESELRDPVRPLDDLGYHRLLAAQRRLHTPPYPTLNLTDDQRARLHKAMDDAGWKATLTVQRQVVFGFFAGDTIEGVHLVSLHATKRGALRAMIAHQWVQWEDCRSPLHTHMHLGDVGTFDARDYREQRRRDRRVVKALEVQP